MRRFSKCRSTPHSRAFPGAGAGILLTACGGETAEDQQDGQQAETGTHTITDHAGYEIEVPDEVDRIVVCDILPLPSVLTVFFDSADKIVGMSEPSMTAAANGLLGELYPEILDAETGFIDGTTVNTEELLKLEPDVVFYSASSAELGEQLRQAGFAAVAISANKWEYNTIETLNNWISLISEIFPDNDKSEIVQQYSEETYNLVQERVPISPMRSANGSSSLPVQRYHAAHLRTEVLRPVLGGRHRRHQCRRGADHRQLGCGQHGAGICLEPLADLHHQLYHRRSGRSVSKHCGQL